MNQLANGGKRPGSGRKPKELTLLKRRFIKGKEQEAERAFALCVALVKSEETPEKIRMDAAREVMDRVWGKPNQRIEVRDWREQAKAQGIEPDVLVDQFKAMILAGKVKQDAGDGDSNS